MLQLHSYLFIREVKLVHNYWVDMIVGKQVVWKWKEQYVVCKQNNERSDSHLLYFVH